MKRLGILSRLLVAVSALSVFAHAGGTLVSNETLGLRVAPGFRITLYSDHDLANDIYAMTLDSRGRVVVTSQGWIKTLHDTDGDGKADKATVFAETKTGGMGMCFDGNDLYFVGDGALGRFRDADGNGQSDGPPEKLLAGKFGEHGGHAMRKGPDGSWYFIGGNDAGFSREHSTLAGSPVREPEAGCLVRLTPDGKHSEILAHGFRNPYDFDFNWSGDIFTYDSDTERDAFLPWYTPTRVYHVAYGGHHGWRLSGYLRSWNRPDYYADAVDILRPVGRGSPTGVVCYRHNQFPAQYRDGLFVLDWTFGKVFFFPLKPDGSSYRTQAEVFLEPIGTHGFAPTDAAVAPDGSLFISIGGRKTRGAVYRVEYVGDDQPRTGREKVAQDVSPGIASGNAQSSGGAKEMPALVLDAPQPLDAWSRARWQPLATNLSAQPFDEAVLDEKLTAKHRVRAIEIVNELFDGLSGDTAARAAEADEPAVRAAVARALHERQPDGFAIILLKLAEDMNAFVRRCALESLTDQAASVASSRVIALLPRALGETDKRLRQSVVRLAARLEDVAWKKLWATRQSLSPQAQLGLVQAYLERSPKKATYPEAVAPVLEVMSATDDRELALQAVRLLMIALGDWHLRDPSIEVFAGYELPRPLAMREPLRLDVLRTVRRLFPSGEPRLDAESARLLAMLQDDDASTVIEVLKFFTDTSSPTSDFHYLTVLAQFCGNWPQDAANRVANSIVHLDAKLAGQQGRTKQTWNTRLAELVTMLIKRDSRLAGELVKHRDFSKPAHVGLVACLPTELQQTAAESFCEAVKRDATFEWSGPLVHLLARLPSTRFRPLLRQQWSNFSLRDEILLVLAREPEADDRDKFLTGLESAQLSVVAACVSSLNALPRDPTAGNLKPLLRLLRRSLAEPKEEQLRRETVALVARQSGQSFEGVKEPRNKADLKRAYQPVFDWFAREFPAVAKELESDGDQDPVKWTEILKAVAWDRGDAGRGEKTFRERACQTCHVGGGALGPSLAGAASRMSREDLFAAILFPNRDVAPAYRTTTFQTRDGQTYTGIVVFVSADGVIVQTGATVTVRLDEKDIVSQQPRSLSLMPGGLLDGLKPADLADLYSYLQAPTSP